MIIIFKNPAYNYHFLEFLVLQEFMRVLNPLGKYQQINQEAQNRNISPNEMQKTLT